MLAGVVGAPALLAARRRPNVVIFMTDDHSAWATGAYGCPDIHTTNIDRLAEGGNLTIDPNAANERSALRTGMERFFRDAATPPIEEWRTTTTQELTVYKR
jgi:hypothetical protein